MASLLIADSGSTKTDWCLLYSDGRKMQMQTSGINPLLQSEEEIKTALQTELKPEITVESIDRIEFYGAGIKSDDQQKKVRNLLLQNFHCSIVNAQSDLLAAARATCGKDQGVVCILGTGSNSGYYDGEKIVPQNPSLGYILGDEGSGAYLGKRVLQYYFYNIFGKELSIAFEKKYGDDLAPILKKVYSEPFANRYLATFVTFLKEHREHFLIKQILEYAFTDFYQRHILNYAETKKYRVHFCGSIAHEFRDIIMELQLQYGLSTGKFLKSPMAGLIAYHQEEVNKG